MCLMAKLPSKSFDASFRCGLWTDAHAARELLASDLLLAVEVELLEISLREREERMRDNTRRAQRVASVRTMGSGKRSGAPA